eukprot:403367116
MKSRNHLTINQDWSKLSVINSTQELYTPQIGLKKKFLDAKKLSLTPRTNQTMDEKWKVFERCDLRVGKIVKSEPHPESEKLYINTVDLGEQNYRMIASGLNGKIHTDEMVQGLVLVFANIRPKKCVDFKSQGMLLCACDDEMKQIELIRPPDGSQVGQRVQLAGNPIKGEPLPEEQKPVLTSRKKYAQKLLELLKTDNEGAATYDGVSLESPTGKLKCKTLKNMKIL